MSDLIPLTVLTGFLGSGKTTVLNHLLAQPGLAETAVLINEFGEIGLDHLLVSHVAEDIVLLNSGCLCCTVRGDMVTALRDLFLKRVKGEVPEFGRVVIETTGLADPAPIIHTLMTDPLLSSRYRLDGLVTTIDAVNGSASLDHHEEAVKQAAVADRLVLTKTDLADYAVTEVLRARLRQLNPGAPILIADNGAIDPADILDAGLFNDRDKIPDVRAWMHAEAYADARTGEHEHVCGPDCDHDHDGHDHDGHDHDGHDHDGHDHHHDHHGHGHDHHGHGHHGHHHDVNRHDDRVQSFVFTQAAPVSWAALSFALEMMISNQGENLLRIKGIVNAKDSPDPLAIHGVQHVFHPPVPLPGWPDDDHRTRIVFITRDLPRETVAEFLDGVLTLAEEKGV